MQLINTPIHRILPTPLFQWRQSHAGRHELTQSLQKFGFIAPLIGFNQGGEVFLIDGYERLSVAQELAIKEIPVTVFNISLEEALIRRLSLNNTKWSSLELSHILNAAKSLMKESEIALKIASLLNIQSPQQIMDYVLENTEASIKNKGTLR